jgi:hypothetical protein
VPFRVRRYGNRSFVVSVAAERPSRRRDVAFAETRAGAIYVESDGVGKFAQAYDYLEKSALTSGESAALITAAAERMA